jgi:hypothetical protein
MTASIDNLNHKEWMDLVMSPDTTRGDAMVAFCAGEPLDFNPYDVGNPKHTYWAEGYDLAKSDKMCWERRERNMKHKVLRGV